MQGTNGSAAFCPVVMAQLVALVVATLAYALAGAVVAARRAGEGGPSAVLAHVRPSTLLWELPFLGALAFLWVWCARGLYSGGVASLRTSALAILVAGLACLPRLRLSALLARRVPARRQAACHTAATVVLLALCEEASRAALEVPWNDAWLDIAPQFVAIEATIIGLALLALYFLFQRRGAGVALGVGFMLFVGIAQYFVFLFKDANITPADLQAIDTAAEVSGGYVYVITPAVVRAVAFAAAGIACAAYLMPPASQALPQGGHAPAHAEPARREGARAWLAHAASVPAVRRTTLGLASALALALFVTVPGYGADFGVSLNHWNSLYSTSLQGFFPCFVKEFQARLIPVPQGYTEKAAKAAEKSLVKRYRKTLGSDADTSAGSSRKAAEKQFEDTKPSVVVIMNESFSDLSVYKAIAESGYTGPDYVKNGTTDAILRGDSYASIFGGGTCNSEFEALCGVNLHYLGSNKYPYTQWDFTNVDCMPRQFAQLGYQTTAIHPNLGTNWDRERVYRQMGFDKFLTIDNFDGAETYHNGYVSDRATYQRVLDVLASSDKPQFVHDVTMQNHGPFTTGTIPGKDRTNFSPAGATSLDNSKLNEYLACATESDRAISWFVGELRKLDRPVVVLFFGDHQPKPASPYATIGYEGEPSITTAERMFHSSYFMWANYDVAGDEQAGQTLDEPISALGDELMYRIGAPLTARQEASLASQLDLPVLSLIGYKDANGTWHAYGDDEPLASPDSTRDSDSATHADSLMGYVNYLEFGSIVN
ncbi:LTA synthase family protein [Parafannyhessea sp. LCP21S3_E6]|uniref:LTA synthase family protein n=1 Tax=unclassified Parafannyhessea TaxID=2847323 RepID=UPI003F9B4DE2